MLKSRTKLIVVVAVVVVAVAAGAGAFFFGKSTSAASVPPPPKEAEPVHPGPQYLLKERIINLSDPGAKRYAKVAMAIEMGGSKEKEELAKASGAELEKKLAEFTKSLAPWAPLIDDAVISQISARSTAELSTPEGKNALKQDIKEHVNRVLGAEMVTNVFFTQFVMQ